MRGPRAVHGLLTMPRIARREAGVLGRTVEPGGPEPHYARHHARVPIDELDVQRLDVHVHDDDGRDWQRCAIQRAGRGRRGREWTTRTVCACVRRRRRLTTVHGRRGGCRAAGRGSRRDCACDRCRDGEMGRSVWQVRLFLPLQDVSAGGRDRGDVGGAVELVRGARAGRAVNRASMRRG